MYLKKRSAQKRLVASGTGALLWFGAQAVSAATQEITAVFRPDPAHPMVNKFINTTPVSGVCAGFLQSQCKSLGIFSIRTAALTFTSNKPIPPGPDATERQGVMFKVPSEWRAVEVTSDRGESQTVEVRIAGIGNRFYPQSPATTVSWGPSARIWGSPPPPCLSTGLIFGTSQFLEWFWRLPENAGSCSRKAIEEIPGLRYSHLDYAYELRTPNPLAMSIGQYRGSITYTIGPNQDFDFGDAMTPNDDTLNFNFTLDVQHTLKVDIPPGGNRVVLEPQGGWHAWLQQGRKPTRLFRDQSFQISTSSRFKMNLECEFPINGNSCAVVDRVSAHSVPLLISGSLPRGLSDAGGGAIERRRLFMDGSGTELIQPDSYLERKPATLHFEIPATEVASMIDTGRVRHYSGNVTVIWDSEI
jgi:hypothetical protein